MGHYKSELNDHILKKLFWWLICTFRSTPKEDFKKFLILSKLVFLAPSKPSRSSGPWPSPLPSPRSQQMADDCMKVCFMSYFIFFCNDVSKLLEKFYTICNLHDEINNIMQKKVQALERDCSWSFNFKVHNNYELENWTGIKAVEMKITYSFPYRAQH